MPYVVAGAAILYGVYATYKLCKGGCCSKKGSRCNVQHRLSDPKICHAFDIESLGDKTVYCRCWKSHKFPYCKYDKIKFN